MLSVYTGIMPYPYTPPKIRKSFRSEFIADFPLKSEKDFVSYRVENTRAISQALLGFVIYIRNYGGLGVSNPLTLLVWCDTPIFYNVENTGGRNG